MLVTGELLVTFHPGTNFHVEEYLEKNGMEVILPRITYQFRKDFQAAISEIRDFGAHLAPYPFALDGAVEFIQRFLERIARKHPLYRPAARPQELHSGVGDIIPKTLTCGEGWLMAGEIAHYAAQGVRSFIILQTLRVPAQPRVRPGRHQEAQGGVVPACRSCPWTWTRTPATPTWRTGSRCSS